MSYIEQLDQWFQRAKREGRVVDMKFFLLDPGGSREMLAKTALETLTGKRETRLVRSADTADPAW